MKDLKTFLEQIASQKFRAEDGSIFSITLLDGLSANEAGAFQKRFPKPVPQKIIELLNYSRGFEIPILGRISFTGDFEFAFEEVSPLGIPVATDHEGNFWFQDVNIETGAWEKVFFISHDPPVLILQASSLAEFLEQIVHAANAVDDLTRSIQMDAQKLFKNELIEKTVSDFKDNTDVELYHFVKKHPENSLIADLRQAGIGEGFTLQKRKYETEIVRFKSELFFVIDLRRKNFLARLFG